MDFASTFLFFLQVSDTVRGSIVQMTAESGESITIRCPVNSNSERKFWCREEIGIKICNTIISTSPYVHENYRDRVSINNIPTEGVFIVEIRSLNLGDSGLYTCGTGKQNDKGAGRTLQVKLMVSDGTGSATDVQTALKEGAKYASYVASGTSSLKDVIITPTKGATRPVANILTRSATKGIPQRPRKTSYAHSLEPKSSFRNQGKNILPILAPVTLFILMIVASMPLIWKHLRRKKVASRNATRTHLRMNALQQAQGHVPVENIYSECPRQLKGA
uniref:Ig-like domain-containing protein n=1 Tax=Sphenodon punctatus TaxID=8508 RepID=A0A8D0GNZ0_SPHPU